MIEKIRSFFTSEPVEVEDLDNVPELFREQKQQELAESEKKFDGLRNDTEQVLEELQLELEELEGYEDEKSRAIVEDVVDNIAEDRQRLVEDFEMPEGPEQLLEELESLVEEFETLTEKEAAVLEEAHLMGTVREPLDQVRRKKDELEQFIGDEYSPEKTLGRLEELAEKRQKLELQVEQLEMELEETDVDGKYRQVQQKQQELDNLNDTEEWQDYREKQAAVDSLEDQEEQKERELEKAASKMERGMKKLVYSIQNNDLGFTGDIKVLEEIRDGKTEKLLERDAGEIVDAVESATGVLPTDLLDSSVHQRFMDGAQYLMELENRHEELYMLRDEIQAKKRELENHEAVEKKQRLENQRERLQRELEELEEEKKQLRQELEEKKEELEQTEEELRQTLQDGLNRKVDFC